MITTPTPRFRNTPVALGIAVAVLLASAHGRAEERSFLWKATSPAGGVVYLAGSIHVLTEAYYPLSPAFDDAFRRSDLLVEEVDLGIMTAPESQLTMLQRGMLPAGQSLKKVVSPETYGLAVDKITELGLPIGPLEQFKPWSLALMLQGLEWQKAGFNADAGLDKHFYDAAEIAGKTVEGLETVDFQIAQMDEMPMPDQERLLAETIKELATTKASFTKLADAWKAGNAPVVEDLVLQDLRSEPAMYERLLVSRNRTWLPKVEALFSRPSPAFVVVGAAHLIGPDGLLQILKAKGYTLEQL